MEVIGCTRTRDGKEVEEFVVKCSTHEFYYKGMPPLTHGCKDCWLCYYFGQLVQAGGDFQGNVAQLEEAIIHAAELADDGKWDFKPEFNVSISHTDEDKVN